MHATHFDSYALGAEADADEGLFARYWAWIKAKLTELLTLPAKIRGLRQEALGTKIVADARGLTSMSSTLSMSSSTLSGMIATADAVAAKIKTWLPKFQAAEAEAGSLSGLGVAPILILGVMGMAALAYIAVKGAGLLKDYALQRQIVDGAKAKLYSMGEAQALIKAGTTPTFAETAGAGVATALAPIGLALAGVLALVAYQRFGAR